MPQLVHKPGGYKVQGRKLSLPNRFDEALALQEAGADVALVECILAELAARLTAALDIPLIGIGAGPDCDAQVLQQDMAKKMPAAGPSSPKFPDRLRQSAAAVAAYVRAVKSGEFPGLERIA